MSHATTNTQPLNSAPAVVVNRHDDPERDKQVGLPLSRYNLNFQRQPKDHRDLRFRNVLVTNPIDESTLPNMVDLRMNWKVLDQGPLGSCVSNAVAGCIRFVRIKENRTVYDPSRLYIYYYGRVIEGCVPEDSGLYVRDAYKAVDTYKCCSEINWPYIIGRFTWEPSATAKAAAATHKGFSYIALDQNRAQIKKCLADGYPVTFGMYVYESFMGAEVATTGAVPMPAGEMLGGHCMTIVGYDDACNFFIVANSWSTGWGDKGYCYIPYDYLLDPDQAGDFWTVRSSL